MKNEKIKAVYKCCCLTEAEYTTYKNEIAQLAAKAASGSKTDLLGHEYSPTYGHGWPSATVTDAYRTCAGTACYEARLGEAALPPSAGSDPLVLQTELSKNKYCEKVSSLFTTMLVMPN
jgi:hypothetical protein